MADDPEPTPREEQPEGDYPVLPPDPLHIDPLLFPESADLDALLDAGESEEAPVQFSLGELFVAMFVAALFLGILDATIAALCYLAALYGLSRCAKGVWWLLRGAKSEGALAEV